ncbi:hypothetical protein [Solirubrum puertoriconensis]|uniref:Uncharacterized protein n=1 Tax=Solirubrum puertoriconensis TaxID=1751427 RepID=A0A9X0L3U9_SOLP1|nr:hypothetical protein [Solirubrum puertoriconensis]KUG06906.1 hypothetical protein ASU33_06165 [Solirubrum puertoriconensis]
MSTLAELADLPAKMHELEQRFAALELQLQAYVEAIDDDVDTATALQLTGINSRTTLVAERDRKGTLLKYRKEGTKCLYSRRSCIDYKLSKRLGGHCYLRVA